MGQVSNFLSKSVKITDKFSIKYWVIGAIILAVIILPRMGMPLNPFAILRNKNSQVKQDAMTDRTEIRQEARIERTAVRQGEQTERTAVRQGERTNRTDIRQNSRTDRAYNRQQHRQQILGTLIDAANPLSFLRRRKR